jgi:hypothetical protein
VIKKRGKVKDLLMGPEEGTLLLRFRDRVTAGRRLSSRVRVQSVPGSRPIFLSSLRRKE